MIIARILLKQIIKSPPILAVQHTDASYALGHKHGKNSSTSLSQNLDMYYVLLSYLDCNGCSTHRTKSSIRVSYGFV